MHARTTWWHEKGLVKYLSTNPVWLSGRRQKGQSQPNSRKVWTSCMLCQKFSGSGFECHIQQKYWAPVNNYPELSLSPTGLTSVTVKTSMLPAAPTKMPVICLGEKKGSALFFHSLCLQCQKCHCAQVSAQRERKGELAVSTSMER